MVNRGEIWWAERAEPIKSQPGFRRPVLVIQSDTFNQSKISTVICAVITSNLRLSEALGIFYCWQGQVVFPRIPLSMYLK